ncbi:small ribosomal subunit protein uS14m isoform X1 [Kogia breviceps]|uniref:small ribosomal subunit protein uS14m isoform X1 n=1 Tax=Kogia breviceps TaxID=27615 RepID=UPI0034D24F46
MAASTLGFLLRTVRQVVPSSASGQVRSYYVDWKMLRDVKRRKMAYEYADERLRINSLRKNTILPKDLQDPGRWWKSKRQRSPSSPQIHQKYIYTCNNYRTPTEHWQKTSDLPKGKKLPTYLGRAKEKRINRDKRIGTGPAPV